MTNILAGNYFSSTSFTGSNNVLIGNISYQNISPNTSNTLIITGDNIGSIISGNFSTNNISLGMQGLSGPNYGGGQGTVFLTQTTVNPTGSPTGGIMLTNDGNALFIYGVNGLTPITSIAGCQVNNLKNINANVSNAPIGTNQMYITPANRSALVCGCHGLNTSAGNIVAELYIQTGSINYGLAGSTTIATNTALDPGNNTLYTPFILRQGMSLQISVGITAGLNAWSSILEFDNTAPIHTAFLLAATAIVGNNTIYTCPQGKTAKILSWASIADPAITANASSAFFGYGGSAGSTITYTVNLVPNAGTVGLSNRILPSSTLAINTALRVNFNGSFGPGDFLNINLSVVNTGSMWWVNIMELFIP